MAKVILILTIMMFLNGEDCTVHSTGIIMDLHITRTTGGKSWPCEIHIVNETNLTTASSSQTLVGVSLWGGEGDAPSSSWLLNVENGVADILVEFHWLLVFGANAETELLVCLFFTCSKHLQSEPKQNKQLPAGRECVRPGRMDQKLYGPWLCIGHLTQFIL